MPAIPAYYFMKAATWFSFMMVFTMAAIYRIELVGLGPLELILVGTALELAIFLCEIPTGVVADVHSRRLSITLGFAVMGLGCWLEILVPSFAMVVIAQVVFGAGYTLLSGAEDAWLADEIGEERLTGVMLRGQQVQQLASLAGIAASVGLAHADRRLPFFVAGCLLLLMAPVLRWLMPETGFRPTPTHERSSWAQLRDTLERGVRTTRRSAFLVTMMAVALCYGLSSEGLDRLWEAHLLEHFTFPGLGPLPAITWFGLIHAAAMVATLVFGEFVRRRAEHLDHRTTALLLGAESVLMVAGLLAFAFAGSFWLAIGAYVGVYAVRHIGQPVRIAWINRRLTPETRATVLSTVNQMDAAGQLGGGPAVGLVGRGFGLRIALATVAVLLMPLWGLYARAYGQDQRQDSSPGTR